MSWEMYEAAKKIADGWYSELEATRMRNAVLGRDNAKLRESVNRLMTQRDERLAKAEADNAQLREQIHWLKKGDILHVLTDQEYIDQCERERLMQVSIDALAKNNEKLRELVRISIEFCADGMCGLYDNCPLNAADGRCMFDERARELGVEVGA